jgi:hypothetical protein
MLVTRHWVSYDNWMNWTLITANDYNSMSSLHTLFEGRGARAGFLAHPFYIHYTLYNSLQLQYIQSLVFVILSSLVIAR